jgi:hypothetical protein
MRVFLLLALLSAGTTVSAQIYRWVDEKGRVNYSNWTPEAGVEAKVIDADAVADPFTTTITLIRGRISDIDRVRKF